LRVSTIMLGSVANDGIDSRIRVANDVIIVIRDRYAAENVFAIREYNSRHCDAEPLVLVVWESARIIARLTKSITSLCGFITVYSATNLSRTGKREFIRDIIRCPDLSRISVIKCLWAIRSRVFLKESSSYYKHVRRYKKGFPSCFINKSQHILLFL